MPSIWVIGRDSQQTTQKLGSLFGSTSIGSISIRQVIECPEVYQEGIFSISLPAALPDEKSLKTLTQNLRNFVQAGGSLVGLQGSATRLQAAFPETALQLTQMKAGELTMTVCDPALAEITGATLTFSTDQSWEMLQPDTADTFQVYLTTEAPVQTPVVYSFVSGIGMVFSQPLETHNRIWDDALFKHLFASAFVHPLNIKARQKQKMEHAVPLVEYPMVFPMITPAFPVEFSPAEDKIAMVMLHWDGDSKLHLHIEDELQRMVLNQSSSQSTMVWSASLPGGKWYCSITQPEEHGVIVPAILSVCAAEPFAMRKLPQKPSSIPHQSKRCPACNMPLNHTMRFCPACGRKVN